MGARLTQEQRLERLWAQEDELETRLRTVRAASRRLAAEVGRGHGFMFPPSRETLQWELTRKK